MSPLLLGALVVGGVGALALMGRGRARDPAPTPAQLDAAMGNFRRLSASQAPGALVRVGPLVYEQLGPTMPDAAYVLELVKFAARSKPDSEDVAERRAEVARAQLAVTANDAPGAWAALWRLTQDGLFAKASDAGIKSQRQRDDEINAIITNLLSYELYWREATGAQDRVANLVAREAYIVSRILAKKVRARFGARFLSMASNAGCQIIDWPGRSWYKFLTPIGIIQTRSVSVSGCDVDRFLLELAAEVAYAIGQTAVLSINAKEYVGYDFDDLMAGISGVGQAFKDAW